MTHASPRVYLSRTLRADFAKISVRESSALDKIDETLKVNEMFNGQRKYRQDFRGCPVVKDIGSQQCH